MAPALESTDARNKLEDLSGITIQPGENPYKALIEACEDDAVFPTSSFSLFMLKRIRSNGQYTH